MRTGPKRKEVILSLIDDNEHRSVDVDWAEAAFRVGRYLEGEMIKTVKAHQMAQEILQAIFEEEVA